MNKGDSAAIMNLLDKVKAERNRAKADVDEIVTKMKVETISDIEQKKLCDELEIKLNTLKEVNDKVNTTVANVELLMQALDEMHQEETDMINNIQRITDEKSIESSDVTIAEEVSH